MRRGHRKMWWVVPCTSRKSLQAESQKDIEEILKAKLTTIKEEPELCEEEEEENDKPTKQQQRRMPKKGKKIRSKVKMGRYLIPQFSLKASYALFMTGFASRGSFIGLLRY